MSAAPRSPPPAGSPPVIPGFVVRDLLGRGGMGTVYRALEVSTGREVALKWLAGSAVSSAVSRFEREARAAAALKHPNIVPVLSAGSTPHGRYIALELVHGKPLSDAMAAGLLGERALVRVFAKVARALHAAHEAGVVHRDVKPQNIIIAGSGEPVVIDFGLARFSDEEGSLTGPQQVVGTLAYMSPEVASGGAARADSRSDVFSLGCTLYEALAGRPPFEAADTAQTLVAIVEARPAPLPASVEAGLQKICLGMLARAPDARPTALAVAEALEALGVSRPVPAARSRAWLALAAVGVAGAALGGVAAWSRPAPPAPTATTDVGVTPVVTTHGSAVVTAAPVTPASRITDEEYEQLRQAILFGPQCEDPAFLDATGRAALARPCDVPHAAHLFHRAISRAKLFQGKTDSHHAYLAVEAFHGEPYGLFEAYATAVLERDVSRSEYFFRRLTNLNGDGPPLNMAKTLHARLDPKAESGDPRLIPQKERRFLDAILKALE